ncbi:putative leucine-rich repeat domain superfamily [Helianthus annuus]|uniref:Leucine-rich repeat domain superfamily n=1 Tax=Helianthus annuus TaxID=4232 RepID=A0A9K3JUS3_HELAN|nr:putative leucine-rich repeat domain superfamily [Helianthus annuus]KAJ0610729.1 putative leucine-rich repeat domain superfamily [Helianthus annuus]KAJ0621516.1 putative leucine-rich repeat domain superfamily [Helianthus annuus]KAJ0625981.1 putative leucine-rich repeat domain superfamily [Helianthus annuus]KAJ0629358.1 putative leucine-rich repeat domain superfamily [Helianthus annuus]
MVFDVSFNELMGPLPESISGLVSMEQLNVASNYLSGSILESVRRLPQLEREREREFF